MALISTSMKSSMARKEEEDDFTAEEVEKYIREEFSDCFHEKLGKENRMRCNPEELIIGQEEVEPHHRSVAWDVPTHYLKEARGLECRHHLRSQKASELVHPELLCRKAGCTWEVETGD